jgi:tripartite-type tricarboxylate transporter receptor subunit TctC
MSEGLRRRFGMFALPRLRVALLLPLALVFGVAAADDYPTKPIRLIVPFPAGGSTDSAARLIAARLSTRLGQQMVIDNRPGAGTTLAMELLARAPADGYTLGFVSTSFATSATLYRKLSYDPVSDFTPVAGVAGTPVLLVANAKVPARSARELIALAKAKPGEVTCASSGNGTILHLTAAMFAARAGIDVVHVPYKGENPAITDLIAGQTMIMFVTPVVALPHIKSGKLRALASTSAKRLSVLPEVATLNEAAVPGFEVTGWFGLLAPAKTPLSIVNRVYKEITVVLALPDLVERLNAEGMFPTPMPPEAFGGYVKSELQKWAKVVKESGAKIE